MKHRNNPLIGLIAVLLSYLALVSATTANITEEETPPPKKTYALGDFSLFYTDKEIKNIERAINIYEKRLIAEKDAFIPSTDDQDYLSQLEERTSTPQKAAPEKPKTVTFPTTYLRSIVYHTPKLWSAWINTARITNQSSKIKNGFSLLEISHLKAKFEWKPPYNYEFFKNHFIQRLKDKKSIDKVEFNPTEKAFYFELHPYQTFSAYEMDVIEGLHTKPVVVDIKTGQIQQAE